MSSKWESNESIQRFREYLRIPSVHPDVDYGDCVKFLLKQASLVGLPASVHEFVPANPVVVITLTGTDPDLPSIMLNSHMDVVPVYEDKWTYPPFAAEISDDGFIYARGTQDMKSVGMMHFEAVKRLKEAGVRLKRTVHITFVPDEEVGGIKGMKPFTESQEFKQMNVGFELDESHPWGAPDTIIAFHGERTCRFVTFTCKGEPMHGSMMKKNTAGEKIQYIIDKCMKFREEEIMKLEAGVPVGEVTTVNLTMLEGGKQVNILPDTLSASFDMRVAPQVDHESFDQMIAKWCKEAGEGVTYRYHVKNPRERNTNIEQNHFFTALENATKEMGIKLDCRICPGTTDARYIRRLGISAINFSPIVSTPLLLHAHDERIHVDAFLKGIDIMEKVVKAVGNVNEPYTSKI